MYITDKYKCDRCGVEFESRNPKTIYANPNQVINESIPLEVDMHLCEKCTKAFHGFIKYDCDGCATRVYQDTCLATINHDCGTCLCSSCVRSHCADDDYEEC